MRKRRWKSRKGAAFLAFALALALGLSGTGLLDTHAAGPVETDREDCTLSVDLSELFAQIEEDYAAAGQEIREEAAAKKVVLNLYQAADVDVSGKYTAVLGFKDAPLEKDDGGSSTFGEELAAVDSETAAAEWEAMAAAAAGVTEELAPVATRTASKAQTSVTFTDLPVGLYLVVPQQLETPYYFYNFTPYLVSVPDNDFNPDAPAGPDNTDDWVYDVKTILKWSPEVRYGDLKIIKHRDSTNGVPLKAAAFVFEVSVDPLKGEDQQHMVSVIFENDPNKTTGSVTLEDLPAGSTVKVEEVYSGAGYELESGPTPESVIIIADGEAGSPVQVEFTNTVDGSTNGGYGIVNNFRQGEDGEYEYTGGNVPGGQGQTGEEDEG